MAITYGQMQERILRTLQDPGQKQNPEDLVYDAVIAAHNAILQWVPMFAVVELTSGSGGSPLDTFPIPSDAYQVDTIQLLTEGIFLPHANFGPGTVRNTKQSPHAYDWIEYPSGYISLSEEVVEGDLIKVYYRTFWPQPASASDTTFVIRVPSYAHMGMIYYACAHCLLPRAVGSGGIRQFNTRTDSGSPDDNPLYNMSNWFLQRFAQEMKLVPSFQKVGE